MPTANRTRNQSPFRLLHWIPKFLELMSAGMSVRRACKEANITPSAVYQHRNVDEDFRACWDRAVERGTELLEQEAVRRAYHGVEKDVYYKGEVVGTEQQYSDSLLMFMLRARKPETYRDKEHSTTVNVQTNVQANTVAAQAIREMIADGSISGLLDGSSQEQPAPLITGTLDDGRQRGEVDTRASFSTHEPDAGAGVANTEQQGGSEHPIPARKEPTV